MVLECLMEDKILVITGQGRIKRAEACYVTYLN